MTSDCQYTARDLFVSDRENDDFQCHYKGFTLLLSNGMAVEGCESNYVAVHRLGVAYFALYLSDTDELKLDAVFESLPTILLDNPQFLLPKSMQECEVRIRNNNQDVRMKRNQLPVLRSFWIYTEARLPLAVKEDLVSAWSSKGFELNIRDLNYVEAHQRDMKPYAFICHDWRDKETVARPLADALRSELGPIWYDEFSLRVGDSLRERIESGLKGSDRCVVILSQSFLQNVGWAKREFDSMYVREIVERNKVILPLWVDVTPLDLYEYSPILADRVGVQWSDGLPEVVKKLRTAIRPPR